MRLRSVYVDPLLRDARVKGAEARRGPGGARRCANASQTRDTICALCGLGRVLLGFFGTCTVSLNLVHTTKFRTRTRRQCEN